MANIIKRPEWHLRDRTITPESIFLNRRRFLHQIGLAGAGCVSACLIGCSKAEPAASTESSNSKGAAGTATPVTATSSANGYPPPRNSEFNPNWLLTDENIAAKYNNFYEFSTVKDRVHRMTDKFVTTPWPIEVSGLIETPMKLDVQELIDQMTLEERVYRFRCVDAWAMIVPWTGFPLHKLIEKVSILSISSLSILSFSAIFTE